MALVELQLGELNAASAVVERIFTAVDPTTLDDEPAQGFALLAQAQRLVAEDQDAEAAPVFAKAMAQLVSRWGDDHPYTNWAAAQSPTGLETAAGR